MVKPILLIIRKKTRVPTKKGVVHQWRSDWKKVGKIDYATSVEIFKTINGTGKIETDAQFALLMYKSFGPGIYHINSWRKGHAGIRSFFYVELREDGFIRMKRSQTLEEKERNESYAELKRMKKQLDDVSGEERNAIQEDIDDIKETIGIDTEMISLMKTNNVTPYYLKSTKPIYRFHAYEDYENKDEVAAADPVAGFY